MKQSLQRLTKYLAYFVAVVVIFLAVTIGLFRLMLPQSPEYQKEIKDWVSTAIGVQMKMAAAIIDMVFFYRSPIELARSFNGGDAETRSYLGRQSQWSTAAAADCEENPLKPGFLRLGFVSCRAVFCDITRNVSARLSMPAGVIPSRTRM